MTFGDVIKAAIPGADEVVCDHVLWGRTPFPMGKVTARSLYRAASRLRRATASKIQLCDFCDNRVLSGHFYCSRCCNSLSV